MIIKIVERRQSRKTMSSPPLMGTPKLQLLIEQLLNRKPRIYQKRSSTIKDIKKNHKTGRRDKDAV